jgi:hypothetical protein
MRKIRKEKREKGRRYYRNNKKEDERLQKVGQCRLVGAVSTICRYSVDYNSGPVARAIQNKLLVFLFFLLFLAS